jgi:hypothetical protein
MENNEQNEPFFKEPETPALRDDGVVIAVSMQSNGYRLHGICGAPEKIAEALKDTILHNVSIIINRKSNYGSFAFPLVGDYIVFPDDIHIFWGYHNAYFNLDLAKYGVSPGKGTFYILAAFDTFLSEVIELKGSE